MAETRATYSRRAASKNTDIKKDDEHVLEKVSLFMPFVLNRWHYPL